MRSDVYLSPDFILFIVSLIITSLGIILLRSMELDNYLFQFLRDCLGNIGGVVTCSFLFIWYYKYFKAKSENFLSRLIVIICVFVGMIIYETIQIFLPWSTFDVKDIWASLAGAVIAIIINLFVVPPSAIKHDQ